MSRPRLRVPWCPLRRVVAAALLLVAAPGLYAQPKGTSASPDTTASAGPWVPSLREIGRDAVDLVRGPFALSAAGWGWTIGATGVLVGTAATLDVPAYRHLSTRSRNDGRNTGRRTTASLARPGEWYDRSNANRLALGTVGGLALSGLIFRNRTLTRTSVQTLEAIVFSDLITGLLKSVLNRDRPYVGDEPAPFAFAPGAFSGEHTELALPSGHTARVFAVASVLSEQAGRWYVSAPLYAGAASVGLERVRSGDHWLTDVVVGAVLGTLIGRSVVDDRPSGARSSEEGTAERVRYEPVVSTRRVGMRVHF